jgi:hypothetical protein
MGVFVAGTGFNQPVGFDSSSDGFGDEFHRLRAWTSVSRFVLSALPIFNGFWLIRWRDK